MITLQEQKYTNQNRLLYHGSPKSFEEPDNSGIFFVSNDIKYALFYATLKSKDENGGYIHFYRIKQDLNIFNAKQSSDLKRLRAKIDIKESNAHIFNNDYLKPSEPKDSELFIIQNKDWLFFLGKQKRNEIINIIKNYGIYDGFFNFEGAEGISPKLAEPSIGLFDVNKLQKVDCKSVKSLKQSDEIQKLYEDEKHSIILRNYENVRNNLKLSLESSLLPENFIEKNKILKENLRIIKKQNNLSLNEYWLESRG